MEPPNVGMYCDLLWSDPLIEDNEAQYIDYTYN